MCCAESATSSGDASTPSSGSCCSTENAPPARDTNLTAFVTRSCLRAGSYVSQRQLRQSRRTGPDKLDQHLTRSEANQQAQATFLADVR
ncbi:protein of unknown function [Micropruina glycogenica]|uniref:Uncharacterized protein n=1 Tax=Micropruina glycogenica TaxID=75385 RepID=A0A2N9JFS8_9ACTN|nr:protein of unknown function [Micropruina glycogenica]